MSFHEQRSHSSTHGQAWNSELTMHMGLLPEYARKIAGVKFKGPWFDTLSGYNYAVPISEQIYIEQARMSVLGQSPEITLFCLSNLLEPRKAEHVSRLRRELPALRRVSAEISSTKPLEVDVLKPPSSPHVTSHPETYILDLLGTIGIPLNPSPGEPSLNDDVLVTAHGAHNLEAEWFSTKRNVFLTSGAIFQLSEEKNERVLEKSGLDSEASIAKDTVHARALTLDATSADFPQCSTTAVPQPYLLGQH